MSNDDTSSTMPNAGENSSERLTGRVKWFNNRAGFGFVTVMEGEKKDEDVFVHHSGIVVNSEQYKYLVQGEYVSFALRESDNEDHPYQAGDVKGVLSGWLMCETRNENRNSRNEEGQEEEDDGDRRRTSRPRQGGNRKVRPTGRGPRDNGTDEWVLTRRRPGGGSGGNQRRSQNSM